MEGYPAAHCHAVTTLFHGDEAFVLIYIGNNGYRWFDGIRCIRDSAGWHEQQTYTCEGGMSFGEGDDFGFLAQWGEVPPEVEAVRLTYDGETVDVPVSEQSYVFVCWRARVSADWPVIQAYHVAGGGLPPINGEDLE